MRFFTNCCNGGGGGGEWEIFTGNWGKPGMGGLFSNGGNGKSLKSLYVDGRGVLGPLFDEDPPYIANLPFPDFDPPPPPTCLSPPTPNPTVLSAVLFLSLNG